MLFLLHYFQDIYEHIVLNETDKKLYLYFFYEFIYFDWDSFIECGLVQ